MLMRWKKFAQRLKDDGVMREHKEADASKGQERIKDRRKEEDEEK